VDESGEIQAVVNSEGENRGEAFFQLRSRDFSDQELGEFLDHAEQKLFLEGEDGLKKIDLHIGPNFIQLARVLENRGYRVASPEKAGILEITSPYEVHIPDGLRLAVGEEFSDEKRGLAHSLAFGYAKEGEDMLEKYHIVEAFQNMRRAPDYRADLDLVILDGKGMVAAFANFWFDEKNRIGILEPLGTTPEHQKIGLASALLAEGINRLRQLGAGRLYGGAGQPFYSKFGLKIVDYRQVWSKEWGNS
jgi:GNAT superfamily N-acetyltransferase